MKNWHLVNHEIISVFFTRYLRRKGMMFPDECQSFFNAFAKKYPEIRTNSHANDIFRYVGAYYCNDDKQAYTLFGACKINSITGIKEWISGKGYREQKPLFPIAFICDSTEKKTPEKTLFFLIRQTFNMQYKPQHNKYWR